MLIRPPDELGAENQEARQRYEVMQCFTVSQPKSIKEEGEGRIEDHLFQTLLDCFVLRLGEGKEAGVGREDELPSTVLMQDFLPGDCSSC